MVDWIDDDYDAAVARGRLAGETEFRATAVRYEHGHGRVVIELSDGCTFSFPSRALEGLQDATEEEMAEVEITGLGVGIRWEKLDLDFSVEGLLNRRFGSRTHMTRRAERACSTEPDRTRDERVAVEAK